VRALPRLLVIAIVIALGLAFGLRTDQQTDLTFLSVGQGDCTVFRTQGLTLLVDVGPEDAGQRLVVPALRKMGVASLDLVLLSHPDADHIGGLAAVAKRFRIGKVVIPASFRTHPDMVATLKAARVPAEQVLWLSGPNNARFGDFELETDSVPWAEGLPDNDGSMFVRLKGGNATATFSGDASETAENLMEMPHDWGAQILHTGHHGSSSSTSYGWIREVHPKWAIVSCGRDNAYGHPAPDTLKRLADLQVPVLRTDREGTIRFTVGPNGFELAR